MYYFIGFLFCSATTILMMMHSAKKDVEKEMYDEIIQGYFDRVEKEMRINEGNKILNGWLEKIEL